MQRSTLNSEEFQDDSNRIVPYWKKPDGSVEPSNWPYPNPEENPDFSFIAAAGGIASTVNEMTKYMKMQLSMGEYAGGRLASKESFEKIQTMHIRRPEGYYGETGYGYGLSVTPDFLGHKMIGHGGSILVSTAYMAMIPDINAGVIMMGNSAKIPYEEIAESIFAIMMDKTPEDVIPPLCHICEWVFCVYIKHASPPFHFDTFDSLVCLIFTHASIYSTVYTLSRSYGFVLTLHHLD
jgi:CubicO group peptidase (beta-lactamase class C family)